MGSFQNLRTLISLAATVNFLRVFCIAEQYRRNGAASEALRRICRVKTVVHERCLQDVLSPKKTAVSLYCPTVDMRH